MLGNFYKPAPSWRLHALDVVALDIALQNLPNEYDPVSLPASFLAVHPESFEALPVVKIFKTSYMCSKVPGNTLKS